jgi:DNA-binding transcriptional ArsR family regulator
MTKPSVSKHLRILEHAGLIESEKRGQFVHYRVADRNMLGTLYNLLATFCPVGGPLKRESRALAKAKKATG